MYGRTHDTSRRRRSCRRLTPLGTRFAVLLLLVFSAGLIEAQDLTIGLMPAVDSIPLLVAQDQGYFADEGIEVELQIFRNQLYRETALQTNAIDGSVSDLINGVYNWRSGSGIRVGSITDGHFSLVVAPDSPIRSIADWNRASSVDTGLLENSIIFYVAERMLESAGGTTEAINLVTTMQVPARMEMVVAGRIEAALLPEPITRIAVAQGARVLVDTSRLDQTPGVLLFTERARSRKGDEIAALYRGYNRAVAAINADPDRFRPAIIRLGEFPPAVERSMVIPTYQPARPPSPAEVADVTAWMVEKGLIDAAPAYREIVATGLIPPGSP
jgi:NitT/TauT family transport system substrate-binding protein